ncbi:sulfotransferase [soil metagenome]
MPDLKVLAIIGRGRSGSTILDNLLGEIDGFVSVGELHNFWQRALIKNEPCGCGRLVAQCALWAKVLDRINDTYPGGAPDPRTVVNWQEQIVRSRHTRRLLEPDAGSLAHLPDLKAYTRLLGAVYEAIGSASSQRVIVDSSKRPAHGALLHLVPGITPYFIHLVRDVRAVAYSRRRKKVTARREMRRSGSFANAFKWIERNLASEAVRGRHQPAHSCFLRYEDFITDPARTLRALVTMLEEKTDRLPLKGERTALLGRNHAVAGNPSRFHEGEVMLRLDDEWIYKQRPRDRATVTAITLPLLRKYGYPWRPTPGGMPKSLRAND